MMRRNALLPDRGRRGLTMLGLLALAVLLAGICATLLERSRESIRAGGMLEWRLQARAAAEGMAVLIAADPRQAPPALTLGPATVAAAAAESTDQPDSLIVPLEVTVGTPGSPDARYQIRYRSRWLQRPAGWQLLGLEE